MPIINKGIFDTDVVFQRQLATDWPTVNTNIDLYVENLIAAGNVIANGLIIRNIEVSDSILTGNISAATITANTLVLDILTANTGIFGEVIASGNLIANGLIIRGITVSDNILTGNISAATITANTLTLDTITANTFVGIDTDQVAEGSNLYYTDSRVVTAVTPLLTTANVVETSNLYFSNTRARQAFSAGRGIVIQENGVIKSTDDSDLYNLDLNGSVIQNITLNMAPILSLPTSPSSVSYVVQSLHVTNISEETALLSANVVFASNSTVTLFNKLALPVGASMELFDKGIALKPGDKLNVQSFNQSEVATSNVISAFLVHESVFEDESFVNAGTTVANPNSNVLLYDSNISYTILESIKISNLQDVDIPVRVYVTNANANIKGYLAHNMPIPSDSVVDILKKPKRLERNDRIYVNYTDTANTNAISVFLSGRIGAYYVLDINPGEIAPGTESVIGFETTAAEGTQLYYTIRPA